MCNDYASTYNVIKITRNCVKNQWQRLFRLNERPQTSVIVWRISRYVCLIRSFVNAKRVEQGAWSIDVDSISNVHPSIQLDYYNTESRRGTRISYFRGILSTAVLYALRITADRVLNRIIRLSNIFPANMHVCTHTHIRIYTCNIPSKFAFSSCICVAFGKETNPVVFLAHVNIVCGLSDISGWIYHAAIHCSASRYISCKNNTWSDANMRNVHVRCIHYLKKIWYIRDISFSKHYIRCVCEIYTFPYEYISLY